LQPAFVLHRRRYGDTSLLLELLTRDAGRLAAVGRGAAGPRAGRAGLLQPFVPLLLGARGRGEVLTLAGVEAAGRPFALHGQALYCGLYLNELLLHLTVRGDPQPQLFAAYLQTLGELAAGAAPDTPLRRFELDLLRALGFGLQLVFEADGRTPVRPNERYDYRIDAGPVPAPLDGSYSGDTLLRLERGDSLSDSARAEARQLMREVLNHYLGGRPLRSRELFRANP
jgi:DNA repair protein RecO (recombination protein O)